MFTINRTGMAKYYNISDDVILSNASQLWHQMFLTEGLELGYDTAPEQDQRPTALPFLYSTPAAADRYRDLIDRIDLMTDQALNGNQP